MDIRSRRRGRDSVETGARLRYLGAAALDGGVVGLALHDVACYVFPRCLGPSHPDTKARCTGDDDSPLKPIEIR